MSMPQNYDQVNIQKRTNQNRHTDEHHLGPTVLLLCFLQLRPLQLIRILPEAFTIVAHSDHFITFQCSIGNRKSRLTSVKYNLFCPK